MTFHGMITTLAVFIAGSIVTNLITGIHMHYYPLAWTGFCGWATVAFYAMRAE